MTSVKATEKFSAFWNYQLWDLAKGQQVDGGLADYLLESGCPVERVDEPAAPPADPVDPDAVPDGTIAAVLDWVGDDPAKAARALEAEQGRPAPRSTLVDALQKLVDANPTT